MPDPTDNDSDQISGIDDAPSRDHEPPEDEPSEPAADDLEYNEGYEPDYPEDYTDEEGEYEGGYPRDAQIDAAKKFLMDEFFPRHSQGVFYSQQIQILVEDSWAIERITGKRGPGFFHWITGKALRELSDEGRLDTTVLPLGEYRPGVGEEPEAVGTTIRFYWLPKLRYTTRAIGRIRKLVQTFSAPELSHAIGHQGEMMFDAALPKVGFLPRGENVSSWGGRTWTQTKENLDRIFERDSIHYGVEIKNTLSYIGKKELLSKLEMCKFLGLVPLFVMRASAKSYNYLVESDYGGYALIFRFQLYPLTKEKFVKRVQAELGIPVDCPKAIAYGTLERLLKWHTWKHKLYGV